MARFILHHYTDSIDDCMTVKCKVIESLYANNEVSQVKVYGLAFYKSKYTVEPIKVIEDIYTDKKNIKILCDLINANDLDEIHIYDFIEDMVCLI